MYFCISCQTVAPFSVFLRSLQCPSLWSPDWNTQGLVLKTLDRLPGAPQGSGAMVCSLRPTSAWSPGGLGKQDLPAGFLCALWLWLLVLLSPFCVNCCLCLQSVMMSGLQMYFGMHCSSSGSHSANVLLTETLIFISRDHQMWAYITVRAQNGLTSFRVCLGTGWFLVCLRSLGRELRCSPPHLGWQHLLFKAIWQMIMMSRLQGLYLRFSK